MCNFLILVFKMIDFCEHARHARHVQHRSPGNKSGSMAKRIRIHIFIPRPLKLRPSCVFGLKTAFESCPFESLDLPSTCPRLFHRSFRKRNHREKEVSLPRAARSPSRGKIGTTMVRNRIIEASRRANGYWRTACGDGFRSFHEFLGRFRL